MAKKIIRKPAAKPAKRTGDDPVTTKLAAIPKSFADIRMTKGGKTTVQDVVEKQRLKLAQSVTDQLKAYVELGKAMIIAQKAIDEAGGKWVKFMEGKPLGIGRSTADRYKKIAEIGAEALLAAHQKRALEAAKTGEEATLNVKQLISDVQPPKKGSGKKGPDSKSNPVKSGEDKPNRPTVTVADLPAPATSISDDWVDSCVDTILPSLTAKQAERLSLALSVRIEELHEAETVIEGEAEAA